ncbi:MAG: lipid II:glycine glycyltransferase FemX [Xanthobacteraceae bacterium]
MSDVLLQDDLPGLSLEGPLPPRYRYELWRNIGQSWDSLVATFADACLEQMAAYAAPRWGGSRLCGLVLRDLGTHEPVALALVMLATIPLIKSGMGYVKFGPLWRRQGDTANPEILAAVLAAIKQAFARQKGLAVRIMPPPDPTYAQEWQRRLLEAEFRLGRGPPNPERYLVDLRLTENEQMASVSASWRSNLKRALAAKVEIGEADPQAGLPDFMALYRSMAARKHFQDRHHVELLPAFAASAHATLELGMRLFLAYHEGRVVAGSIIVGSGDRVFAAFSASDEHGLSARAGYALRWWIINRLRGTNAQWLDLGGDEGSAGLRSFKTGNVGKRGQIVRIAGEYEYSQSTLSSIVSSAMSSAHSLMQGLPVGLKRT